MTRKPTRRRVERVIDRAEDDHSETIGSRQQDVKVYNGVDLSEGFPLPDDAREHVERASKPDTPARVVCFADAESAAAAFENVDQSQVVGMDLDALTDSADEDADDDSGDGPCRVNRGP